MSGSRGVCAAHGARALCVSARGCRRTKGIYRQVSLYAISQAKPSAVPRRLWHDDATRVVGGVCVGAPCISWLRFNGRGFDSLADSPTMHSNYVLQASMYTRVHLVQAMRIRLARARAARPAITRQFASTITHVDMSKGPPWVKRADRARHPRPCALAHRLGRLDQRRRALEDQLEPDATSRGGVVERPVKWV